MGCSSCIFKPTSIDDKECQHPNKIIEGSLKNDASCELFKQTPTPETIIKDSYNDTDLGYAKKLIATGKNNYKFLNTRIGSQKPIWLKYENGVWKDDINYTIINESLFKIVDDVNSKVHDAILEFRNVESESIEAFKLKSRLKHLRKEAHKLESLATQRNIIGMARTLSNVIIDPDAFDKDAWIFNVANGTIDLKTQTLQPHIKEDYLRIQSPVIYDKTALCPCFDKFINETFQGNSEMINYMQKWLGYCMTGDTTEESFDIWYGIGGNGKSKLVSILVYIFGDYYHKMEIESIEETPFKKTSGGTSSDIMALKGKRLITVSESSSYWILNEAKIKDFTGNEPISARNPFELPETFRPIGKYIIIANTKPDIKGKDNGIWRRLKLKKFDNIVPLHKQDLNLEDKLIAESSGVFNWLLEGIKLYLQEGLILPNCIQEDSLEYRRDNDNLIDFLELVLVPLNEIKIGSKTPNKFIHSLYVAWCKIKGLTKWEGQKTFKRGLESRGFKQGTRQSYGNVWDNMELKEHFSVGLENLETTSEGELVQVSVGCMVGFTEVQHFTQGNGTAFKIPYTSYTPTLVNGLSYTNPTLSYKDTGFNNNNIITYLKNNYDMLNKPKDKNPEQIRISMKKELNNQFPEIDEDSSNHIINDYCKSKGW